MKMLFGILLILAFLPSAAFSWDGINAQNAERITIESGTLVREGKTIDVYDHESGNYKTVIVEDIRTTGITKQIDITDPDTGETETYDMIGR